MLLDPSVLADPYDFYRTLREQAPVWSVPGTEVVTISTFDLLSEAVARPEDFSSTMRCLLYRDEDGLPARLDFGDAANPTLAAADPPLHTAHRRAVFPELVARRMRALEDDIRALSATTVASALRDNNFDFMATIGNIVPITVVAKLIGFRDTNPMQLLQAAFESTTMVGGTMPLDRLNDLITRIGVIQAWIKDQVTAPARATTKRSCWRCAGLWTPEPCRWARFRRSCTPCSAPAESRQPACSATPCGCLPRIPSYSSSYALGPRTLTCSWKRPCDSNRHFGTCCAACPTTPHWAASISRPGPRPCCSLLPGIEIPPNSTTPIAST